ncbi:staphylopine uptake ABC transporter permease subunit CntC [Staphylococcus pasteuri]|uniref:staphylopine uptake ABC transporter permease subunit CntC n=1 Tax=Staphylococcus pasteuri TaxID=45972 RepID=UPI00249CE321|nr:nickel/cobalt ABC transporter permease [Staphylococcus pasteuri]MDI3232182.1 ABC transporter permease [Staphylococcus pasteuri]
MMIIKRLLQDKGAVIALIVIATYIILGLTAPLITVHEPNHIDTANKFAGISTSHWLGTDHLGRDILTRIIYAIRPSLLYVLIALFVSVAIGAILGFISGYFRGYIDALIMRCCDVMLAFPSYVVTLALITLFGMGVKNIILAFILTRWAWFCRVIRTSVMQYTAADHVKFAKTIGMSHLLIIRKHILPLTLGDIAVISSSAMCSMILQMSGFSFLGLGVKAPTAEWGMMLNEARKVMFTHPELMVTTGIVIVIIVMAFNFLSDALQVAIDPRISSKEKLRAVKKGVMHE